MPMSRHHNFNVMTSQLGKITYKRNTLRNFHCHINLSKLSNPSLLKTLDDVTGNVVEEILQDRAEEVQT